MVTRQEFIDAARKWVGTPYHHQARVKGVGCDCIGLVVGVAREFGYEIDRPEFTHYGRSPRGQKMLEFCESTCGQGIQLWLPGSIAVFYMNVDTKRAQHIAIVTEVVPHRIMHCYEQAGGVVEHGIDDKWLQKWICSYNLPFVN